MVLLGSRYLVAVMTIRIWIGLHLLSIASVEGFHYILQKDSGLKTSLKDSDQQGCSVKVSGRYLHLHKGIPKLEEAFNQDWVCFSGNFQHAEHGIPHVIAHCQSKTKCCRRKHPKSTNTDCCRQLVVKNKILKLSGKCYWKHDMIVIGQNSTCDKQLLSRSPKKAGGSSFLMSCNLYARVSSFKPSRVVFTSNARLAEPVAIEG